MAPKLLRISAVLATVFLLITTGYADLRVGNVRGKGTCEIPPYDCLYTQAGWHKTYGTWYVSGHGMWSDGIFSEYFAMPFGISCESLVHDVYIGGGFAYYQGSFVPETFTVDFYNVEGDPQYRMYSGCCWPDPAELIARYTVDVADIWPAAYADVYSCSYGDYEKLRVTLDPPMALDVECNYFICYYANGDETERHWATIDMLCGPDQFCITTDAGRSFECWDWFGGEVSGCMDFELRGDILDCDCLCDVCAAEGWDILYDQAFKHTFSNESVYGGLSHGGGDMTNILGQAFNYQWDGCVKCIGVGGVWGGFQGEYDIPEHLIVELWCMAGQVGDYCEPITLLRRWMVPVVELYETLDPEGYPLYNFFTEDYPGPYTFCDSTAPGGEVWATDDRPFLFVCYSDGDETAPFLWFTDMCKGYCRFSISEDCEFTWGHDYDWGPPEEGNPEANFSFVLCGGCNEVHAPGEGDEVVDSGYLAGPLFGLPSGGYPGWVWFSVPLDPADCCDAADCYDPNTLLGFEAKGKLFYWDKYGKFTQVYSPPFVTWPLEVGASYLFYMDVAVPNPIYGGIDPYVSSRLAGGEPRFFGYDYGYQLGRQGWTWVGMPGLKPIYGGGLNSDFGNKVRVMYPADGGAVRTAGEDQDATPDNWVDWDWAYYDTFLQAPKTFKFSAPFGNTHCYPWIGYRLWVKVGSAEGPYDQPSGDNADQVVLIWPAPECFYDPNYP